jgi:hypothetical protein
MKKTGEKLALFQLKSRRKTGEIRILQEKKTGFFKFFFSLLPCSIYNASGPP